MRYLLELFTTCYKAVEYTSLDGGTAAFIH